jgi:hypothetical protein
MIKPTGAYLFIAPGLDGHGCRLEASIAEIVAAFDGDGTDPPGIRFTPPQGSRALWRASLDIHGTLSPSSRRNCATTFDTRTREPGKACATSSR